MTLKELSQLYYIKKEIEASKNRLAVLRAKMTGGNFLMNGMPKNTGTENKIERYIVEAIDLEEIIKTKIIQCIYERKKLEQYISGIYDSLTRQIFSLRFVDGMSWEQVALNIGGGISEESVRKRVYRYLHTEK